MPEATHPSPISEQKPAARRTAFARLRYLVSEQALLFAMTMLFIIMMLLTLLMIIEINAELFPRRWIRPIRLGIIGLNLGCAMSTFYIVSHKLIRLWRRA